MSSPSQRVRARFALSTAAMMAILSATAAPVPEALSALSSLGLSGLPATVVLHVGPVVATAALAWIGQALIAGRSQGVRFLAYTVVGLASGFFLATCLELFAGASAALQSVLGPIEASNAHIAGWAATGLSILWGLLLGAIALFGSPAARALQDEHTDPECTEVRPRDRALSRVAALGMTTAGISLGALTLLDQAHPTGATAVALATIATGAGLASAGANWVMWRAADEFQQQAILQAYAWSAIVISVGAFAWALTAALGANIAIAPYTILLVIMVVQFATALIAAGAAQSFTGALAKRRTA